MILAALMAASAMTTCIPSNAQAVPRRALPAMKGFELYSWSAADGSPRFSLHEGTNRDKTEAEIKTPTCVLAGLEPLGRALRHLAQGEQVVWMRSRTRANGLADPGDAVARRVLEHADAAEIRMLVAPSPVPERERR